MIIKLKFSNEVLSSIVAQQWTQCIQLLSTTVYLCWGGKNRAIKRVTEDAKMKKNTTVVPQNIIF